MKKKSLLQPVKLAGPRPGAECWYCHQHSGRKIRYKGKCKYQSPH